VKRQIYYILETGGPENLASRIFSAFLITLIALNVVALLLETVPQIHAAAPWAFLWFEAISVAIFLLEYLLRLWCCTESPQYAHPLWGRLRYAVSPLAVMDLLAILPFLAPAAGVRSVDLRFLRAVRLLARVGRMTRYYSGTRVLARVIRRKQSELATLLLTILVLLVLNSSMMYLAEHAAQPDKFSSIPAAMWWGIVTMTTVGYGDVVPTTGLGRLVAGLTAILGIATFALPTTILVAGFLEETKMEAVTPTVCPHCGKEIGKAG